MIRLLLLLLAGISATAVQAQPGEKPLFASNDVIRVTIAGPVSSIARSKSEQRQPGTLTVAGTNAALPITLEARGLTRRASDVCQFPPLWVRFTSTPPPQSIFTGQKSLKLVTHCRSADSFQQYLLLEYAAYRMFNALSPASFRVRLATIDYVDTGGKPVASRYGFFIEDLDDVAKRNGMREAKLPSRIPTTALSPNHAALYALFQHMVANHDWSMRAGPAGDECCHNAKLIAPARGVAAGVIPIPYDFDFSGLVDAPYAAPPEQLRLSNVRQRKYRGYCQHNGPVLAAAVQFRAKRPQILAALTQTPGLQQKTIRKASAYLDGFFADIASNEAVQNMEKGCIG
ncbi:MAG TPA: hypothetical protein VFU80_05835 [Sphingomicrobium sp.]|nr:hypothetical protein [Sphingomicrobium sp.]